MQYSYSPNRTFFACANCYTGDNCRYKHDKSNGDGGHGANGGEKRKSNDELLGQLTKKVQSFKAKATKAESTGEMVGVETARANWLEEIDSIWLFKMQDLIRL